MKIEVSYSTLVVGFIVLLILKLTGTIAWSWFWVTFPLLLPVYFVLAVIMFFAAVIMAYFVGAALLAIFGSTNIDWSRPTRWKNKLMSRFSR